MKQFVLLLLLLPACEQSSVSNYSSPPRPTAPSSEAPPIDAGSDVRVADAAPADAAPDTDAGISQTFQPMSDAQATETTVVLSDAALDTDSDISTHYTDAATALDGGTESAAAPDSSAPDAATDAGDAAADAGPFVCPIPAALGSECDLVTSCGCADGFVCRTADLHTGQTLCFDAGITPPYAACGFDQECGAGSVCEGGLCRPLCDAPDTLCSDDSWCGKVSGTGRTVCLGNCNPLIFDESRWSNPADWIELQAKQFERGLNLLPLRTLDFPGCGAGAYCSPGADGISPFPYCVPSTGAAAIGEECQAHTDCATGLGCGDEVCRAISFVDDGCAAGTDMSIVAYWKAPDGYNSLGVCLPE